LQHSACKEKKLFENASSFLFLAFFLCHTSASHRLTPPYVTHAVAIGSFFFLHMLLARMLGVLRHIAARVASERNVRMHKELVAEMLMELTKPVYQGIN
jgi:hypothetical protein